jgi:hypothetical protein
MKKPQNQSMSFHAMFSLGLRAKPALIYFALFPDYFSIISPLAISIALNRNYVNANFILTSVAPKQIFAAEFREFFSSQSA